MNLQQTTERSTVDSAGVQQGVIRDLTDRIRQNKAGNKLQGELTEEWLSNNASGYLYLW